MTDTAPPVTPPATAFCWGCHTPHPIGTDCDLDESADEEAPDPPSAWAEVMG